MGSEALITYTGARCSGDRIARVEIHPAGDGRTEPRIGLEHAAFEKNRDSQIGRFSDSSSKLGIGGQQGCDLIPTRLDTDTRP